MRLRPSRAATLGGRLPTNTDIRLVDEANDVMIVLSAQAGQYRRSHTYMCSVTSPSPVRAIFGTVTPTEKVASGGYGAYSQGCLRS
jgi:hypothetical protein